MAIYKIASLNYLNAGANRAFLNMDTVLDYELYRPLVLLRNEKPYLGGEAVSAYTKLSVVERDWALVSAWLSSVGGLDEISSRWADVSGGVSAAVLDGMTEQMRSTPLSALSTDIVTEQREGFWLKTEFLAKEFADGGDAQDNAMAAVSSSEAVLLAEEQRYYSELSGGRRMYIRLYPPGTDQKTIALMDEFNARRLHANRTFVLDVDLASRAGAAGFDGVDSSLNNMRLSSGDAVLPMYDMVDVHVKSANENSPGALRRFDAKVTRKREDIYLPQLKRDPIGSCQLQGDAYMLTEATGLAPAVMRSSLLRQRLSDGARRTYTVQLESEGTRTYLYRRREDGAVDVESLPQSDLAGIEYNNITQFPLGEIKAGYSQGNEYGYIVRGKNALDSRYDMTVSADADGGVSALGCRDYVGVGQFAGGQLYFKFHDGVAYSGVSSEAGASVDRRDDGLVPYQKVECAYINRYSSANMHKSRFFSVKILNTELGQYENAPEPESPDEIAQKKLYGQIMKDIRGAVREIVESLQPSHTQLYKVMFDG